MQTLIIIISIKCAQTHTHRLICIHNTGTYYSHTYTHVAKTGYEHTGTHKQTYALRHKETETHKTYTGQ